ncbi:MAG TPA: 16S rRNA (cytidine(1402)-2'-O)-methyltransferase [Polyangia bacterium]|nr:16S rRNA (cytidine(1402)-2'-O)-methyltransferase [Polyangia bacterium]
MVIVRQGTLAVVATPLGDARDLSPRAAETLRAADVVVAEDTRSARRLLTEIGAGQKTVLSCFDANEAARAAEVADRLAAGATVALVSEAGTPLVSDPGYRVVAAAIAAGARVVPVPGPSAVLAALVGAGLPTDRFLFLGFPPRKPGARRRLFESVRALPYTLVLYESPLRAAATLTDLAAVLGPERRACLARELTKPHEELVRAPLAALAAKYETDRPLGEVTLVVEGAPADAPAEELDDAEILARAQELIADGQSTGDAARALAATTGRPRREIYNLITRR